MRSRDFVAYHCAALEFDVARHNVDLAILGRIAENEPRDVCQRSLCARRAKTSFSEPNPQSCWVNQGKS
jgi:hypothetical protein